MPSFFHLDSRPPWAGRPERARPALRRSTMMRVALLAIALVFAWPAVPEAHEIPAAVAINAIIRPEGQRLRVLVRVPLESMRDIVWPLRGPGYLDLARADSGVKEAARVWIANSLEFYEGGTRLSEGDIAATQLSLPSDRSFTSYDEALRHVTGGRLSPDTDIPWKQVMLDVLLEYPIQSAQSHFSVKPTLARLGLRTTTVLRFEPTTGAGRAFTYTGDPGLVALDPRWFQAASRFTQMGFLHILDGVDHLLFLLCLVIPFRQLRPLVAIVTSFTVAHSITLIASASGWAPDALWFPPLVEVLIALSVLYMACENMLGARLQRRWVIAFVFGLVHGFGFSFALRDTLQFAGVHLATSLASFNVGVELGQLAVLLVAIPVLNWLFKHAMAERAGTILLSAFVAHTAWHWMTDRFGVLREYAFTWPAMDLMFVTGAMRVAIVLLVLAGTVWALSGPMTRLVTPRRTTTLLLFIGCLLTAQVAQAQPSTQKTTRSTMQGVYTAAQAAKGKEVFAGLCIGCHTTQTHTGPAFMAKWAGRPLTELFGYLSRMMPKTAPGSLTEDEYVWVVSYILKLNGMPAGATELSAEPSVIGSVQFDSVAANAVKKPH